MKYLKNSEIVIYELEPNKEDLKIRNLIRPYNDGKYDIGIVGVPFDYGVELSGGRVGAKLGPDAIRNSLKRCGTTYNFENKTDLSTLNICDFGNIDVVESSSYETHARVTEVVSAIVKKNTVPIVLGGGHDITFASVAGLCNSISGNIGGINIDAHLDVREVVDGKIKSGTPFRKILDDLNVKGQNFVEIGSHSNLNLKKHYDYLMRKGSKVFTLQKVREVGMKKIINSSLKLANSKTKASFVSVDIDSMPQSFAPGCSAPSPIGIDPFDMLDVCFVAGANQNVKLFDVMELNPKYDLDNRTALLAANLLVSFFNGFANRKRVKE